MKKKVLALVLTLAVLASFLTVPAAAVGGKTFPDAKGHWAEESIMRWSRCGLVNGDDLGYVNPDQPLRRCEMATILSNMLGLRTTAPVSTFRDIDGTEWYARAVLRCAAAGIMQGSVDSMSLPQDYITREEAITMFCRALNVTWDDDPDLSKFSDGDKVSGWALPYLAAMTELGILSGMGDGTVAPHAYITRAGAFALMDKAISVYANAPGSYASQNAKGFVVINANTYQNGDVIVSGKAVGVLVTVSTTDTVRLRDLRAENVDINGKGSVIIAGKSNLDNVEAHTEIEMTVEADATVDKLDINSEKTVLTNGGTVKNLNCDTVVTVTNSGKVENLVADAALSVTNTGTVDKLVANAGITVDNNKGTIKNAEINKGGVVIDGAPQQMTVANGVTRPTNSSGRPISATGAVDSSSSDKRTPNSDKTKPTAVTGVEITADALELKPDGTIKLTAKITPSGATNRKVTWSIVEGEACVSIGDDATKNPITVTALAEGKAKIMVTTDDGGHTAECEVTVAEEEDNPPAGDKHTVTITRAEGGSVTANKAYDLGETVTLTVTPDGQKDDGTLPYVFREITVTVDGEEVNLTPGEGNTYTFETDAETIKEYTVTATFAQPILSGELFIAQDEEGLRKMVETYGYPPDDVTAESLAQYPYLVLGLKHNNKDFTATAKKDNLTITANGNVQGVSTLWKNSEGETWLGKYSTCYIGTHPEYDPNAPWDELELELTEEITFVLTFEYQGVSYSFTCTYTPNAVAAQVTE